MTETKACARSAAQKLVFACSGAADVGAVADRRRAGWAAMGRGKCSAWQALAAGSAAL